MGLPNDEPNELGVPFGMGVVLEAKLEAELIGEEEDALFEPKLPPGEVCPKPNEGSLPLEIDPF